MATSSSTALHGRPRRARIRELRTLVAASEYRVDPQLVAVAVLRRVRGTPAGARRPTARGGARTPSGPPRPLR